MMRPASSTTILSKSRNVDSRCATAMTVRPRINRPSASCTNCSRCAVQRRGRLVQDQDRSIAKEGPGYGKTLPLAPRELHAPVADDGIKTLRQLADEAEAAGRLDRGEDLLVAGPGIAVTDILDHRAVKQHDVLRNDGDRARQTGLRQPLNVDIIDQDASSIRIAHPLQQGEHCRLAGPGRTHQPDAGARLDIEGKILQDGPATGISKLDVGELDATARRLERARIGRVAQFLRHQQGRDRFVETGEILGQIDQRNRHVPCRVQDREA